MLGNRDSRRKWLARATLGVAIGALAVVAAFASTNSRGNPAAPNTAQGAPAGVAAGTNVPGSEAVAGPVCLGSAACGPSYNPGAPLEVVDLGSGQNVGPKIRMMSDTTGSPSSWWDFWSLNFGFFLQDAAHGGTFPFAVGAGAPDSSLVVDPTGKVGVGVTNPLTPLQVGGGVLTPITAGASVMMQPASNNPGSGPVSMVMKSNTGPEMFMYADANNGLVGTASNTPFGFRSNNHTRIWLAANGNIGIGEFLANPSARLQFDTGANSDGVTWNNASSRSLKTNFEPVDSKSVLEKLVSLPMQTWNYKIDTNTLHLGPTAEDFSAAFGLGNSDKSISTLDMEGVTATAVQGLNQKLQESDARIANQQKDIDALKAEIASLKQSATGAPAPAASASAAATSHGGSANTVAYAAIAISMLGLMTTLGLKAIKR